MPDISTVAGNPALNCEDVLLWSGLPHGGLYVPKNLPRFTGRNSLPGLGCPITSWPSIYAPFVEGSTQRQDFRRILENLRRITNTRQVAALRQTGRQTSVAEAVPRPTHAFKDFAHAVARSPARSFPDRARRARGHHGCGPRAHRSLPLLKLQALRERGHLYSHPHNRRLRSAAGQMTTHQGEHPQIFAIDGNFDDCQEMVKDSFGRSGVFLKGTRLVAVNSISLGADPWRKSSITSTRPAVGRAGTIPWLFRLRRVIGDNALPVIWHATMVC